MEGRTSAPGSGSTADRAAQGWAALEAACFRRDRRGGLVVRQGAGAAPAFLWPYSQVLHTAVVLGRLRGDDTQAAALFTGLERYRRGPALAAAVGGGRRYLDDNAWVGLAASAGGRHGLARSLDRWVRAGEDPRGGVAWREDLPSRHACSTGAAALLALRVGASAADLAFAQRCRAFLAGPLARADGLVADHVDAAGRVEPAAWSYNQGLAVGVDVLLHREGVPGALGRARLLATRAVGHFTTDDRLWRQPPAFVAVLLRMFLLLHTVDPDPEWPGVVDAYLERAWDEGRDPASGLFRAGGIGRYDEGIALDQAAVVQLYALRALPVEAASALA